MSCKCRCVGATSSRGPKGEAGAAGPAGATGAAGAAGVVTLAAFGAVPNANGLTLTGTVLNMQPADATYGGGVSTTTQTFAGAKTFNVVTGNFVLDGNGVSIGVAATSRIFVNTLKTFTVPLTSITADILSNNNVVFTYSGANTNEYSSSSAGVFGAKTTGTNSPNALCGIIASTTNGFTGNLKRTFGVRGTHQADGQLATTTLINAEFIGISYSNKSDPAATTVIDENYSFYAAVPFDNNGAAVSGNFTIGQNFGFYCEDYKGANKSPIIYDSTGSAKENAVITSSWQLYMEGTNLGTTGSYIGNRLGVGFAIAPSNNTLVTALLHIGAGAAAAGKAPLKFTTGTLNTTEEPGAMEYNNTFHLVNSDSTRRHIVVAPNTTKIVAAAPYANDGYLVMNVGGTDFKIMTTA